MTTKICIWKANKQLRLHRTRQ